MNKNLIGITIGDIEGIGISLLIKLWKEKKIKNFFLITNITLFKKYLKKNNIKLNFEIYNNKINKDIFTIYNISAKNNIENTYFSLLESFKLYKKKLLSGIINLPLNKEKIINKIDNNFIGQTELYQKLDKKKYSNMIFYSKDIITSSLSTHIPVVDINRFIKNKNLIYRKIELLYNALKINFKIIKPKIVLLGLNPHAGENSKIGREEKEILVPILKKLRKRNYRIYGPIPADSAFNKINIKYYDCFLSIYHDQALIPFKILAKNNGANFTGSLEIIRLSPIHGTGKNITNKNKANYQSLLFCFKLIKKIIKNRNRNC
tara:strand:+ start:86 stop:1042 length:957 start_codon:yes stop_codon:yes gene_type:complete